MMRHSAVARVVSRIGLWALFAFLYAPVVVLVIMSFNTGRSILRWEGFGLDWYQKAFSPGPLLSGLQNTLIVALTATAIAVVLGTMLSIGVHKFSTGPFARAFATLVDRHPVGVGRRCGTLGPVGAHGASGSSWTVRVRLMSVPSSR